MRGRRKSFGGGQLDRAFVDLLFSIGLARPAESIDFVVGTNGLEKNRFRTVNLNHSEKNPKVVSGTTSPGAFEFPFQLVGA